MNGIDFFNDQINKTITVRLLSDDGLVFSGKFIGIKPSGNEVPMIDGLLIELPQFDLKFWYTDPENRSIFPVSVGLLLIDSMDDISFSE